MFTIIFAESDWFGSFCCWGFFIFWLIAWSIGKVCSDIGSVAKNVLENETAQEVGKGVFAAWLNSLFK